MKYFLYSILAIGLLFYSIHPQVTLSTSSTIDFGLSINMEDINAMKITMEAHKQKIDAAKTWLEMQQKLSEMPDEDAPKKESDKTPETHPYNYDHLDTNDPNHDVN